MGKVRSDWVADVFNEFQWVKTSWDDFLMGFAGFYVVFYVVVFFLVYFLEGSAGHLLRT